MTDKKQTLPPYLLPPSPSGSSGKPWRERLDDFLEPYFTNHYNRSFATRWLKMFAIAVMIAVSVVTFVLIFHPDVRLLASQPGTMPEWLNDTKTPFNSFIKALFRLFGSVLSHYQYILLIISLIMIPGTFFLSVYSVPTYYKARKQRRDDEAYERERKEQEYQATKARYEAFQQKERQRAEQERKDQQAAEVAAEQQRREKEHARVLDYLQRRTQARRTIEESINVEIARARKDVAIEGDSDPDAAYVRVRESLKRTRLTPNYGLLRESEDAGVMRVVGKDPSWLPPLPPYPPGIMPTMVE